MLISLRWLLMGIGRVSVDEEASVAVDGRVCNDVDDGFLLDHAFQIFITVYPDEARKLIDYEASNLQKFYFGAQVCYDGGFHTVTNPLRHFQASHETLANLIGTIIDKRMCYATFKTLGTLTNPMETINDKLVVAVTRITILPKFDDEILTSKEVPTINLFLEIGFSQSIIDRFFRPFFGGIFFDRELKTTFGLFDFIFECLVLGNNTLPAKGISTIPEQLVAKLPSQSILLNSKVLSVNMESGSSSIVKLPNGDILSNENGVIFTCHFLLFLKAMSKKNPTKLDIRLIK